MRGRTAVVDAVAAFELVDVPAELARDPAQGRDARARPPALDLAQEALADAGALRDRSQRGAPQSADVPQALADVHFGNGVGRARRHPDPLRPRRRKTEATLRPQ